MRELGDDRGRHRRPPRRDRGPAGDGRPRRRRPRQGRLPGRGARGPHPAHREARGLPHVPEPAGARAGRPLRAHPRPRRPARRRRAPRRAARVVRPVLGVQRRRGVHGRRARRRRAAGGALQPLLPRPGQRPRRPAGGARQGRHRVGLRGHYFWDSEVYVAPFLTYTQPWAARNLLLFRSQMLPAARDRAREMSQRGALFPWRTINGEEASAYYAAGTAQVHIDADVAHALAQYLAATDDVDFLVRHGLAMLVETARMYADLGFWRSNGTPSFHIHGVTGPDEYTTVVNNNLFTNVMARLNLEQAVAAVERVRAVRPEEWERLARTLEIGDEEVLEWARCATGMHIPFDEGLGIHPQDDFFLDREVWDLSRTPESVRPLLLHYHPLVIYRFQVLKQADVVLALYLQGDRFTAEEKRADFEYYDPITTGDSTLSAVVQSVVAAEVGYHEVALRYFHEALYVDLANLHDNTVDGLHVASAGGVWAALVGGFGGMRDHRGTLRFDPRLPEGWDSLTFRLTWRGTRVRVRLTASEMAFEVEAGEAPVPVTVRGAVHSVAPGRPVVVALPDQGPRIAGRIGRRPQTGGTRADGSRITAGVPDPIPFDEIDATEAPVTDPTS
ncbi:glycoside hydrolase family 65 protein [Phycicoccus sp. HDW14]|uniref:glycoside hydrolase family 65 protein n=1 Tax=Phycicoccus sp. HDW14 TaxID=2714941 RepID=UPI0035301052